MTLPDGWNRDSHEMKKNEFGVFEITVPPVDGQPAIAHDSKLKVRQTCPPVLRQNLTLSLDLVRGPQ